MATVSLPTSVVNAVTDGFPAAQRSEALARLEIIGSLSDSAPRERVLLAVVALSQGDLERLPDLVERASQDWRNVLYWHKQLRDRYKPKPRTDPLGRTRLPREVWRQPLDYQQLMATLALVDGELVVVNFTPVHAEDAEPSYVSVIGELNRHRAREEGIEEFLIGSPYPDLYPEVLAGGVLYLRPSEFKEASLTTLDGNDYFIISIQTESAHIRIQDEASGAP